MAQAFKWNIDAVCEEFIILENISMFGGHNSKL